MYHIFIARTPIFFPLRIPISFAQTKRPALQIVHSIWTWIQTLNSCHSRRKISRKLAVFACRILTKTNINYSIFAYIPWMVVDRVANKMEYYLVRRMLCPMHNVDRSIPINNSLSPFHSVFSFFDLAKLNLTQNWFRSFLELRTEHSNPHSQFTFPLCFWIFIFFYFFLLFTSIRTNKSSRALSREMLCQINANQYWYQTKCFVGVWICFCFLLWFCWDRKNSPFPDRSSNGYESMTDGLTTHIELNEATHRATS